MHQSCEEPFRHPHTDGAFLHHEQMSPTTYLRQVIAARLRALMAARPDLDTQVKLSRRAGVSQSTVARILSADSSATADSLAQLARAFGTLPASLLTDDPTEISLLADVQSLKPEARQRLLGFVAGLLADQNETGPQRFSLDLSVPVPPSRRAAHARAVARPIKAPTTQVQRPIHAKKKAGSVNR